jgi:hypothetical protein
MMRSVEAPMMSELGVSRSYELVVCTHRPRKSKVCLSSVQECRRVLLSLSVRTKGTRASPQMGTFMSDVSGP